MNKISELKSILGESFTWNKARLDCFAWMLIALFAVRTVNLSELAVGFGSKALVISGCSDSSNSLYLIII